MANWWNGKLMKWQVDEMAICINGVLMKWQVSEKEIKELYEISSWWVIW